MDKGKSILINPDSEEDTKNKLLIESFFKIHLGFELEFITAPILLVGPSSEACPLLSSSLSNEEFDLIKELQTILGHMEFLASRLGVAPRSTLRQIIEVDAKCIEISATAMSIEIFSYERGKAFKRLEDQWELGNLVIFEFMSSPVFHDVKEEFQCGLVLF